MCAFANGVLIVAPPTLHRQGLVTVLRESWPALHITLQLDSASLPRLLYQEAYAVVVVDCGLLTEPIPVFLERLRAIRSTQSVLLLTSNRLPPDLRQYLAGASPTHTWVPRHAAPATVAALFHAFLPPHAAEAPLPVPVPRFSLPPTPFSRRELEVLRLVVQDCCNQEIADQLFLSVRTVESHRRALLQKAGVRTLVGLAVQAVKQGWVSA